MDQAHPWFRDTAWDRLYETEAAFKPEVNDELDTQNFMKYDEVRCQIYACLLTAHENTRPILVTISEVLDCAFVSKIQLCCRWIHQHLEELDLDR